MRLRAAEPLMIGDLVSINEAGLAIKGHQNPIGTAVTAAAAGGSVTVSERIPTSWREEPADSRRPRNLGITEMLRRIESGEGVLLPPVIQFEIDSEESYIAQRIPQHPLHRLVTGLSRLGYAHHTDLAPAQRHVLHHFRMNPRQHAENLRRYFGYIDDPLRPRAYKEYFASPPEIYTIPSPDAIAAMRRLARLTLANTGRFPQPEPTPRTSPPPPAPAAPQPLPYNPKGGRRISA